MSLIGKVALVTGGAKRVGRAIALELAGAGCDVAVHYRASRADAEQTASQIEGLRRRALLVQQDFESTTNVTGLVESVQSKLGRLDILVNNASLYECEDGRRRGEYEPRWWETVWKVNTMIPAALCEAVTPGMRAARWGRIINLCDICVDHPWANHLAYGASKAGLAYLTRALAKALAPDILVNAVAPGIAQFPERMPDHERARLIDRVPLKRSGKPEEIAAVVRFLADSATYMTGQVLTVDGGRGLTG